MTFYLDDYGICYHIHWQFLHLYAEFQVNCTACSWVGGSKTFKFKDQIGHGNNEDKI